MRWKIYVDGFPLGRRRRPGADSERALYPERWPAHIYAEYPSGLSVEIRGSMLRILATGCQYEFCTGVHYVAMYVVPSATFRRGARRLTKCATSVHSLSTQPPIDVTVHMYSDRRRNNTIRMQIAHDSCCKQELIFFRKHLRFTAHDMAKCQKVTQNIYLRPSCRNLCRLSNQKEKRNVESTDERR